MVLWRPLREVYLLLRIIPLFVSVVCGLGCACDLLLRDQVLLVRMSEGTPPVGMSSPASMAGAEVDCAGLGSFRIVRHGGGGLYVLDTRRAFNRWGQTGISFTGGPYWALTVYFNAYRRTGLLNLWQEFGRGTFTEEEKTAMSVTSDTAMSWQRVRLLDAERYRSAIKEKVVGEKEQMVRLLLFKSAREYMAANRPGDRVLAVAPGEIGAFVDDALVTVAFQQKLGPAKRLSLRIPVNPEMPPYVGCAVDEEGNLQLIRPPLTGGNPRQ
jgi:hypothetical protein